MTNADMNELARLIAGEVLRRLKPEQAAPCVMVLAPRDCELAEHVRGLVGDGNSYFFLGEDLLGCEPCRYVLPVLSCAAMAELAAGGASDEAAKAVLGHLLRGHRVEVLEYEYQAFAGTASHALLSVYEGHAATLAGYGLVAFQAERPDTVRCREMLVTEKVVESFAGASTLLVPATAVVTPLAVDAASSLGLTIHNSL
ncbi:hypothetical protein [uncultured Pseudodesulfovibrio sp.]|uniref:hypothetical protein n=1 Tax=uncultured Pseudodesulfovibrio sp. TaxID=2035858 RepID=UPI0029C6C584|nr:hypothetical protein [uncultured Pseudodesulfovibrio sp.]